MYGIHVRNSGCDYTSDCVSYTGRTVQSRTVTVRPTVTYYTCRPTFV